jgi:hypothetical protein
MNDDEIRKRVQARLADNTLPSHLPAMGPVTPGAPSPPHVEVGSAFPDDCAACDEPATQLRYKYPSGPIAFHHRCNKIWEEERDKPIRRG